jgi:hypothetical protein
MAEQSLRSMIETWSRDEAALRELIDSPEATAGRFGLTSLELGALRGADRLRSKPEPERQMASGFTITGPGTHMPSTQTLEPITITAGPSTITTTPITITAGPDTITLSPLTITGATDSGGQDEDPPGD